MSLLISGGLDGMTFEGSFYDSMTQGKWAEPYSNSCLNGKSKFFLHRITFFILIKPLDLPLPSEPDQEENITAEQWYNTHTSSTHH